MRKNKNKDIDEFVRLLPFIEQLVENNGVIILNHRKFEIPKSADKILLVGVKNNQITADGTGSQIFSSLEEVKSIFPNINPEQATAEFTWSLGYQSVDGEMMIRFETHAAKELLST